MARYTRLGCLFLSRTDRSHDANAVDGSAMYVLVYTWRRVGGGGGGGGGGESYGKERQQRPSEEEEEEDASYHGLVVFVFRYIHFNRDAIRGFLLSGNAAFCPVSEQTHRLPMSTLSRMRRLCPSCSCSHLLIHALSLTHTHTHTHTNTHKQTFASFRIICGHK